MAGLKPVIIDASALIAVLSKADQWHRFAARAFTALPKPFITCESVISECCFMLNPARRRETFQMIRDGIIQVDFSLSDEVERIEHLMAKYDSVPMSLADACLVRLSEIFGSPIFTFDGDFGIYRRHGKQPIPILGMDI